VNRSALILVPLLLAGCNIQAKHDRADANNDNVNISGGEDGNVSFDLPFVKGQVKLPASAMARSDFDIDGVKMYPGATINSFHVEATDGSSQVELGFKAPDAADKVRAYFVDGFREKGVDATASGNGISGTSKDGDKFVIDIAPAGSGSQGTIRINGKE